MFVFQAVIALVSLVIAISFRISPQRTNSRLYLPSKAGLDRDQLLETSSIPQSALQQSNLGIQRSMKTVSTVAAIAALFALPKLSLAAEGGDTVATTPPTTPESLGPPPTDFELKYKDYYADCAQVIAHMRYAIQLEKGNPVLPEVASSTKKEMNDFVSYYRRFQGIAGKQSFSLLYTSINVLAGHYTSYGVKFPVPEKRRKRLLQEFNDIEKNIRKRR